MRQGRFIAFEGGEGCGKSTQARLLADALRARGLSVDLTREPGGTPGAEAIRDLLLDPPGEGWGPEAEALLFAAARADHVARLIRPAIAQGRWVISDRFVDSSRAYQGGAGGVGDDAVQALHAIGSRGLRPDLTILLTVDPETALARTRARDGGNADAIGGRDAGYHRAVGETFGRLAEENPDEFKVISGDATPEEVQTAVWSAVAPLLEPSP
ncbi:Thymidylate kinase [Tsuneonella dongtanensis]|uniref:Thymidylate kinase n=1 Tax=Tsuneonella dongtanensis TaxID=692370 RepID=A0A1B2AES9_9SPHN|nr:dTMP kinase [Tsuneonella dongtanensis]ANY20654.1 Thymidylate kinase [Tsuneonella dongtanensis]